MELFIIELLEIGSEFDQDDDSHLFFNALQRMVSDGLFVVFEEDPDSSVEFVKLCEFVRIVSIITLLSKLKLIQSSSRKAKQRLRHILIRTLGAFLVLKYDSDTANKIRQKVNLQNDFL
jgi:hypothetical protein